MRINVEAAREVLPVSRASVQPLPDVSGQTLLVVGTGPLQEPLIAALTRHGMDVECADPREALEMSRAAVPDLVLLVGRAALGGGQALIREFRSTPELAHTRLLVVARSATPDESTVAQLEPSLGAEGLANAVLRVMHGLPESAEDRVALQELVETATGTVVRQKPSQRPDSAIRPAENRTRPAARSARVPPAAAAAHKKTTRAVGLMPPPPAAAPPPAPPPPAPLPPLPEASTAPPPLPTTRAEQSAPTAPTQASPSLTPPRSAQRGAKSTLVGMPSVHEAVVRARRQAESETAQAPALPVSDHPEADEEELTTLATAAAGMPRARLSEEPTAMAAGMPQARPSEEPTAMAVPMPQARPSEGPTAIAAPVPTPRAVKAEPYRPGLTSLSAMLVASGRPTQGARLELSQRTALPVIDPRGEPPTAGEEQTENLRRVRKASKRLRQDSGAIEGKTSSDPSALFDLPMMDSSETGRSPNAPAPAVASPGQERSASALYSSAFRQLGAAVRVSLQQGLRGLRQLVDRRARTAASATPETEPGAPPALPTMSSPAAAGLGAAVALVALLAVGLFSLVWSTSGPTEVPTLTITGKPGQALQALPAVSAQQAAEARPAKADGAEPPAAAGSAAPESSQAAGDGTDEFEDDLDEDAPESSGDARVQRRIARANAAVLQGHRFRRRGAPNKAAAAYQRALQAFPNYPRALTGLVQVSLARKQGKKALLYARKLVRKKPRSAQAQRLLGDAYRLSGNQRAAKATYRKAARLGSRLARKRVQAK